MSFEVTYKIDGEKFVMSNVTDFTIAREGDSPMMIFLYQGSHHSTGFYIEKLEYMRGREVTHISRLSPKSANKIRDSELPNDAYHRRIKRDAELLVSLEYDYLEYLASDSATVWGHPMTGDPFCTIRDGEIRYL